MFRKSLAITLLLSHNLALKEQDIDPICILRWCGADVTKIQRYHFKPMLYAQPITRYEMDGLLETLFPNPKNTARIVSSFLS